MFPKLSNNFRIFRWRRQIFCSFFLALVDGCSQDPCMAMCATHFYTSRQLGWFVSSEVGYDPLIVLRLATSFGEARSDQYALVWHLHYLTISPQWHNSIHMSNDSCNIQTNIMTCIYLCRHLKAALPKLRFRKMIAWVLYRVGESVESALSALAAIFFGS